MRDYIFLIIGRITAAAVAALIAHSPTSPEVTQPNEERFLEAEFYSIGAGINEEALDVVLKAACEGARSERVVGVYLGSAGGFEGERSICIEYTSESVMRSELAHIRMELPSSDGYRPLPRLTSARECRSLDWIPYAPIDACAGL